MLHYQANPELPEDNSVLACGKHTDYGVLIILLQDEVGGLEVQTKDNEWIKAPPIPGTFVVNLGDMLEIWTGGLYQATWHRVQAPRCDRYSIPFFFDPGLDTIIEPIAQEDAEVSVKSLEKKFDVQLPVLFKDYSMKKYVLNLGEKDERKSSS